jgi:hypothetical protein
VINEVPFNVISGTFNMPVKFGDSKFDFRAKDEVIDVVVE